MKNNILIFTPPSQKSIQLEILNKIGDSLKKTTNQIEALNAMSKAGSGAKIVNVKTGETEGRMSSFEIYSENC